MRPVLCPGISRGRSTGLRRGRNTPKVTIDCPRCLPVHIPCVPRHFSCRFGAILADGGGGSPLRAEKVSNPPFPVAPAQASELRPSADGLAGFEPQLRLHALRRLRVHALLVCVLLDLFPDPTPQKWRRGAPLHAHPNHPMPQSFLDTPHSPPN